jgi:hypothetical protein
VVLSHQLWTSVYGGDPAVIGRTVRGERLGFTVIGVTPARFTGVDQFVRPAFFVLPCCAADGSEAPPPVSSGAMTTGWPSGHSGGA